MDTDYDDDEDNDDNSIDEFITQMNHSDQYKNIFKIMVKGRRLFFRVQGMNEDFGDSTVAENLLHFNSIGLSWNNPADRVPIMRVEASNIRHLLRGIGRFRPNEEDEEDQEDRPQETIDKANALPATEKNKMSATRRQQRHQAALPSAVARQASISDRASSLSEDKGRVRVRSKIISA